MPRLLVLSRRAPEYHALLAAANLPSLERLASTAAPAEALALGNDFDILFGEPALIREVLPSMPALRWAQLTWAGAEPLLDPSLRRDYILTNARGVFGGLMSEYVFGYLLAHERRIFQRRQAQQAGQWDNTITGSLRGKRIGLLGVGSIGFALAATARHFDMIVRGYTLASESCPDVAEYFHPPRLPDFARGLDYLVNVLPGTPAARRIVDAALLACLPPHAVFINAGRGSALDEPALVSALRGGKLVAAVLDVCEEEPLPAEHPFWQTPGLLLTFHTSAPSFPADLARLFSANYRRYVGGQPLLYPVDFARGY